MIRSTQTPAMRRLAARREAEAARLREDLLHHLWTEFPQHCVTLGDAQARTCVEHVIARGQGHGFTSFPSLRGYANLMVFLGSEFDEDPQLPWAGTQLRRSRSLARPNAIGELLSLAATQLARIAGREGQHYRRAILWVRSKRFDQLRASYCQSGDPGLHAWLHDLWTPKYEVQDKPGLAHLIADARVRSGAHALLTTEAIMVYSGLMFLLGSGFERDPFHPWAALALAKAPQDPAEPARRIHAAAVSELERFLALDRIMQRY